MSHKDKRHEKAPRVKPGLKEPGQPGNPVATFGEKHGMEYSVREVRAYWDAPAAVVAKD